MSEETLCPSCGGETAIILTPELKHWGKLVCLQCGNWIKWVADPDKPKIRRETTRFYPDMRRCTFCGRFKDELGNKESMEVDHIFPLSEDNPDSANNVRALCTSCHKLKHWAWLYIGNHLREKRMGE